MEMSKERMEYLEELSKEYNLCLQTIIIMAELLGENEDKDGLLGAIEDMIALGCFFVN